MVPRPVLSLRRLRLFAPRLQNIPVFERGDDKSILDLKGTVRQWNETTYTVYETNMTHEYRKNVKWRFVSSDFFTFESTATVPTAWRHTGMPGFDCFGTVSKLLTRLTNCCGDAQLFCKRKATAVIRCRILWTTNGLALQRQCICMVAALWKRPNVND